MSDQPHPTSSSPPQTKPADREQTVFDLPNARLTKTVRILTPRLADPRDAALFRKTIVNDPR